MSAESLPLLVAGDALRPLFWRDGEPVLHSTFLADVAQARAALSPTAPVVNLCRQRYDFTVAFAAAATAGQCSLLPPSRAPQAVAEVRAPHPGSTVVVGHDDPDPGMDCLRLPPSGAGHDQTVPMIPIDQCVIIGHTSGSTGQPSAHRKLWGQFQASNERNMAVLMQATGGPFNIVPTVPPQHMYGVEMALLLPLGGPLAVACDVPLYPADIVAALEAVPAPRLLVTTPLHLASLLDAGLELPPMAGIASATAPLPVDLAERAERRCGAPVIEFFGATETCIIAHRQPVRGDVWTLHEGVALVARDDGSLVRADWLPEDMLLADLVEQPDARHFRLCGRHADQVEIAGKRASLNDLTRRLKAIEGVVDGVMFQLDARPGQRTRRLAALVVAPRLAEADILAALRRQIDPAFLPRRLHRVGNLPRNAVGKLPRAALLQALAELES